jgi:hypothetical protein
MTLFTAGMPRPKRAIRAVNASSNHDPADNCVFRYTDCHSSQRTANELNEACKGRRQATPAVGFSEGDQDEAGVLTRMDFGARLPH